jgi:hypothetical protein
MSTTAVLLTDVPQPGDDFEDYVAALFQASGYFIEKNIVERNPDDVLELDAVATDMSSVEPKSALIEAKGGKWGYPDIFKLVGWMMYLDIPAGIFFANSNDKDLSSVRAKFTPLGVSIACIEDYKAAMSSFKQAGLGTIAGEDVARLWRYSNQVERKIAKFITKQAKGTSFGAKAAFEYHRLIRDGVFFAQTAGDSLRLLYEAYKKHPKLTLGCANELIGGPYDPTYPPAGNPQLSESLLTGKHPLIQATMYLEHRARLSVIKAAADICSRPEELDYVLQTGLIPLASGEEYSLPGTFIGGLDWLSQQPTFYKYPLLWQQFLWGWGGFYLLKLRDQEFIWMSEYSGVPVTEIPEALRAFDEFFPFGGQNWLTTIGSTSIAMTRLTPMAFEGIGAHHRLQQYNSQAGYSLFSAGDFTEGDLVRWNNHLVEVLRST